MMESKITVYHKPTCGTCGKVKAFLEERGENVEWIEYYVTPFSKEQLQALLLKMKVKPADILRIKADVYEELKLDDPKHSDEDLIDFMVQYPDLIQRPIVETETQAILARPVEEISKIFQND